MTRAKNQIGRALRLARQRQGLSQESFGEQSSRTYVSTVERGLKSPTLMKVEQFADVLAIHPLTLVLLAYSRSDSEKDVSAVLAAVAADLVRLRQV